MLEFFYLKYDKFLLFCSFYILDWKQLGFLGDNAKGICSHILSVGFEIVYNL